MRHRSATLAGLLALVVLTWVAVGPWGLVLLVAVAGMPGTRRRLASLRPARPWLAGGSTVVVAGVVAAGLVAAPDSWFPVPPGPGALVIPDYDGRPAAGRPLTTAPTTGFGATAAGTLPVGRPGPEGDLPVRSSSWAPSGTCDFASVDLRPVPVLVCTSGDGALVVTLERGSLDRVHDLAVSGPGEPSCHPVVALDHRHGSPGAGSLIVATPDRALLEVVVGDGGASAGRRVDLGRLVAPGDCPLDLVTTATDAWLLTRGGAVLHAPTGGRPRLVGPPGPAEVAGGVADLDRPSPAGGLAVVGDTAYVVLDGRLRALEPADAAAAPRWETDLDGPSTAPALLPGGRLVVGTQQDDRAAVVVVDPVTGEEICRTTVFEDGAGRITDAPVVLGDAVLVANRHDDAGDGDGLARVRVDREGCAVAWTAGRPPAAPPTVSRITGLAYVLHHAWSPWLVPVTRLAAVDVRTGREAFTTRVATGLLGAPTGAAPALGPGAAAYVLTRGGLVRVADRG